MRFDMPTKIQVIGSVMPPGCLDKNLVEGFVKGYSANIQSNNLLEFDDKGEHVSVTGFLKKENEWRQAMGK